MKEMIEKLKELTAEHPDYPVIYIASSKFVDRFRCTYGFPPIGDQVCVIADVFDGLYAENEKHRFTCKKEKVTKEKMAEVVAEELAWDELLKISSKDDFAMKKEEKTAALDELTKRFRATATEMIQDAIIVSLDPKLWPVEKKEEA